MKSVFTQSRQLMMITVVVFFISLINAGFVLYETNRIENDAKIINYAGFIRGSIQRAAKLECTHYNSDTIIAQVDGAIHDLESRKEGFEIKKFDTLFYNILAELKTEWGSLKRAISDYRAAPIRKNHARLIDKSERCWSISNRFVLICQKASEAKLSFFEFVFIIIGLNIIGVLIIIDQIRSYVRFKLEFLATHDALTGVFNRYLYDTVIEQEIKRSRRYNSPLSVIICDIDCFKKINDTYGHKTGDSVLIELAGIISEQIRQSDFLFRIGGEEFIIIAVETALLNAVALAEKLRIAIQEWDFREAHTVTMSFGVAEYTQIDTPAALFKRADAALYRAKEKGRNRVET